jgi:hypothetical protein
LLSDCCLTPTQQFFAAISWREQVNCQWDDDDDVCFVPDQYAELDFYSARSMKQQSADRHVATLGHIILILNKSVFSLQSSSGNYLYIFIHTSLNGIPKAFLIGR